AAPAMSGIAMDAPRRCTLGKIGSSPTKGILPPVSSGDSPSSCITERNSALMSKPVETLGVSDAVLVMILVLLRGKWTAETGHCSGDVDLFRGHPSATLGSMC